MGVTLDQHGIEIGQWYFKGPRRKIIKLQTPSDFQVKVDNMEGVTQFSQMVMKSRKFSAFLLTFLVITAIAGGCLDTSR